MPRLHITKNTLYLSVLYGGLVIFLFTTDPTKLPLALLLLPIVWLFLCLFVAGYYLLPKLFIGSTTFSRSRSRVLAFLIAILPSMLLLLKSIDQLTVRDGLLLFALILFAVFYASRISFLKQNR